MSVSLPVIVGAGVVIVALLCIAVTARRRRRPDASESHDEPVEAVFVDDMPSELQSFVAPVEPHSEPAAAHALVYPVQKLQQVDAPITFGSGRRDWFGESAAEPEAPVVASEPKLEVVPDLTPELEPEPEVVAPEGVAPEVVAPEVVAPEVVAPVMAHVPMIELPVEQEPTVDAAPVTESVPTPDVALLTAQIEVLSETIARLTDRLDAAVAAVAPAPVAEPPAPDVVADIEPEPEPEPVMLRSVAYEPEPEFALEAELQADIEPDLEPERVAVIDPVPPRPQPVARADRMARPSVESTPYPRKRLDDDLLAWPSDDDLEQFSGHQARGDI